MSKNIKLIVDSRESNTILSELKSLNIDFEVRALDVGDFHLIRDDVIVAAWERKTSKDMAASISDGRYKEQKERLKVLDCSFKGYILEGQYPEKGIKCGSRVVPRTTIDSVMIGLTLRDKFIVYETASAKHTAELLAKMMVKIPEYSDDPEQQSYQESLIKSNNINTVRKQNMTPELCYVSQLTQIPGISFSIATCIAQHYPGISSLLQATETDLSLIKLKERKLGKVLAKRLVDYIHFKPKTKPVITMKH